MYQCATCIVEKHVGIYKKIVGSKLDINWFVWSAWYGGLCGFLFQSGSSTQSGSTTVTQAVTTSEHTPPPPSAAVSWTTPAAAGYMDPLQGHPAATGPGAPSHYPSLYLQVCRESQRGVCTRQPCECRFAHPPENVSVDASDNTVIVCMDFVKGKCLRESCRYFHPPPHLLAQVKVVQQRSASAAATAVGNSIAPPPPQPAGSAPNQPAPPTMPQPQQQQTPAPPQPTPQNPHHAVQLVSSPHCLTSQTLSLSL